MAQRVLATIMKSQERWRAFKLKHIDLVFLKKKGLTTCLQYIFEKKITCEINNVLSINPNSEHCGGGWKIK
jgi:hypothetical protein